MNCYFLTEKIILLFCVGGGFDIVTELLIAVDCLTHADFAVSCLVYACAFLQIFNLARNWRIRRVQKVVGILNYCIELSENCIKFG